MIGLALAVALSVAFIGFYLILSERHVRETTAEAQQLVRGVAASVTDQMSRTLEATDLVLLELAARAGTTSAAWDSDRIGQRLREMPHLRALMVTDVLGRVRLSTVPALLGSDLIDRRWFLEMTAAPPRLAVGTPEAGRFLGTPGRTVQEARRWSIPVARPITLGNGGYQGAVVALLNPDHLAAMGQRAKETFGVDVSFHALDGTLLATSSGGPEGIGIANPQAWMFQDFLPRLENGNHAGPNSAGVNSLASFALATPGMIVVEVSQPLAEVRAASRQHALELAFGLGIIAFSTLLTLALMVGLINRLGREKENERRRAAAEQEAAALLASRAEIQRLLAGLPSVTYQAVVAPGRISRYRYIGGNIEAVTGWPAAALARPEDWRHLLGPEARALPDFLQHVRQAGQGTRDKALRQPDGSWRWLRFVALVLERRPGDAAMVVGQISDITAEREADARSAAAGRLASLGEMATGLAHELKQPLTIMSMAAENLLRALQKGRLDSAQQRAERILQQVQRAGSIIDHLRRFAHGAEDKEQPLPVPLDKVMEGALILVGGSLRDASVHLQVALDSPPPVAMGQPVAIEQVVVNLLVNACHQLEKLPAGQPRRVRVDSRLDAAKGQVLVTVRDNGGGIPPEVMPRLFEPFFTTKGPQKGMGLGLSICHGLMTSMGGSIEAGNTEDGAIFTLRLRAAPSEALPTTPAPLTGASG